MPAKPIGGGFYLMGISDKRTIHITATSKGKRQAILFIDEAKIGSFDLNLDTQTSPASLSTESYGLYRSADGVDYVTSALNTGKVIITRADTLSGIISGTFFFTAGSDGGDKVSITDGRFDYVRKR